MFGGGSLHWFLEAFMLETSRSQSQYGQGRLHPASQEVRTIICPICEGVYAPSSAHSSFLLASDEALEAAFMSLCHFCFRCRRPACPQCWDDVHGVCGDCVREAHLTFRTEVAPLDGMRFPPLRGEATSRGEVTASLLVCVKPGRFVQELMAASDTNLEAARTTDGNVPAQRTETSQEMQGGQVGYGERREHGTMARPARKPQPVTDRVAVARASALANDDGEDEDELVESRTRRVFRIVERVLTVLVLVLLVAIIVLVALALYSSAVNTLVVQVLHVDIRAEVAYLIHLVQQIHS